MNDTPASGERVQKYVFNLEIYRFAKKAAKLPHPPLRSIQGIVSSLKVPSYYNELFYVSIKVIFRK